MYCSKKRPLSLNAIYMNLYEFYIYFWLTDYVKMTLYTVDCVKFDTCVSGKMCYKVYIYIYI